MGESQVFCYKDFFSSLILRNRRLYVSFNMRVCLLFYPLFIFRMQLKTKSQSAYTNKRLLELCVCKKSTRAFFFANTLDCWLILETVLINIFWEKKTVSVGRLIIIVDGQFDILNQ